MPGVMGIVSIRDRDTLPAGPIADKMGFKDTAEEEATALSLQQMRRCSNFIDEPVSPIMTVWVVLLAKSLSLPGHAATPSVHSGCTSWQAMVAL